MRGFNLGPFSVEPDKGCISSSESSTHIEPKAMAVLCQLYNQKGQVVSQQALFESVWPGRVFSPSSLQRIIAILRKALNENSQDPVFLFTHPKLGYRLEVPQQEPDIAFPENVKIPIKGLVISALILLSSAIYFVSHKQTTEIQKTVVTHSEAEEFNSQFSGDGHWLSYQSHSHPNGLFIVELQGASSTNQISLEQDIVDHVWRNRTILALIKDQQNTFSLVQISDIYNPVTTPLAQLTQFEFIDELQIDSSGSLWFVGREHNSQYSLYHYDVLAGSWNNIKNIGMEITSISLAASDYGLYYHYFDGKQDHFGLVSDQGQTTTIEETLPQISALAWHAKSQSLIISDQLGPSQYLYRGSSLEPFALDQNNTLTEITATTAKIAATKHQGDMDIVSWTHSTASPTAKLLVDSKNGDYQGTQSSKGDLAYLSDRFGHPQVILHSNGTTKVLHGNPQRIAFIPPMIWSPDAKSLAIIFDGKITIVESTSGKKQLVKGVEDAKQLFQWQQGGLIYQSLSGQVIQLLDGAKNIISSDPALLYVGIDSKQSIFGALAESAFWGEQSTKLKLMPNDEIRHVFSAEDHLVVHIANANGTAKLQVLNADLNLAHEFKLDQNCHHLSDFNFNVDNVSWLCTQIQPGDDDIVLFEGVDID